MTLLKGQSAQFASMERNASQAQRGVLSGKMEVYNGIVESESEFKMKMIDGEGEVALVKMKEIIENVEMCILDSTGQEVAGQQFFKIIFVFF